MLTEVVYIRHVVSVWKIIRRPSLSRFVCFHFSCNKTWRWLLTVARPGKITPNFGRPHTKSGGGGQAVDLIPCFNCVYIMYLCIQYMERETCIQAWLQICSGHNSCLRFRLHSKGWAGCSLFTGQIHTKSSGNSRRSRCLNVRTKMLYHTASQVLKFNNPTKKASFVPTDIASHLETNGSCMFL